MNPNQENVHSCPMNPSTTPNNTWLFIFLAWFIALASTLASLFFSEVMDLTPCVLCWYQRVFIFGLAIIMLVGILAHDIYLIRYAMPFSLLGLLFALYHSLLFYGFIPESMLPCSQGVPCKDANMVLFDVLPIPILSLLAFVIITVLLTLASKGKAHES